MMFTVTSVEQKPDDTLMFKILKDGMLGTVSISKSYLLTCNAHPLGQIMLQHKFLHLEFK